MSHCTFAVTDAAAFSVNVQVFALFPLLEQAPDQIASRPFDTDRVIDVPVENDADPVLPTATLMPVGLDVTRSPLRPVAVTVRVTACPGGGGDAVTVSVAVFVVPPNAPVIVTAVEALTAVVVTLKVALVAPAATVTLAGVLATARLLLDNVTTAPPAGAALVNVAVPCDAFPPTTLVGLSAMLDNEAVPGGGAVDGVTVSDVLALRRSRPLIVTLVLAVTDPVAIGNVAVVALAGTVRLAGTLAAAFELNNCTTAPPEGAALFNVTVPVDDAPAFTVVGATVTLTSGGVAAAGGFTVSPRLAVLAPYAAARDTAVEEVTALLVTNANDAVVDPVNTVMVCGSDVNNSG
jgi:hypothetical protein